MGDSFFSVDYQTENFDPYGAGLAIGILIYYRQSKQLPQLAALLTALYFAGVYAFGPDPSEPN